MVSPHPDPVVRVVSCYTLEMLVAGIVYLGLPSFTSQPSQLLGWCVVLIAHYPDEEVEVTLLS